MDVLSYGDMIRLINNRVEFLEKQYKASKGEKVIENEEVEYEGDNAINFMNSI